MRLCEQAETQKLAIRLICFWFHLLSHSLTLFSQETGMPEQARRSKHRKNTWRPIFHGEHEYALINGCKVLVLFWWQNRVCGGLYPYRVSVKSDCGSSIVKKLQDEMHSWQSVSTIIDQVNKWKVERNICTLHASNVQYTVSHAADTAVHHCGELLRRDINI